MKKILLSLFIVHCALVVFSQDSCKLRISLLTCAPGEELYAAWGHTAIRVVDDSTRQDMVYNYGTFDDTDPLFLYNFTKGLMRYSVSAYPFEEFVREYTYYQRSVIEQTLTLSCEQKHRLNLALQTNATEPNRYYNYYFHEDNCTTRAKDMIAMQSGTTISYKNILPGKDVSFRNLIHDYLDKGAKPWYKFGIDALLGSNLDKKASNEQAMFLPDYLLKGLDSASANNRALVSQKQTVVDIKQPEASTVWFTPFLFFMILFVLGAIASFTASRPVQKWMALFDGILFLMLGLLGIVMLTLWIIRIDTVCRDNFNLLWAIPTHLIAAFFVSRRWQWVKIYFTAAAIISLLLLIGWAFIPQQLNPAVLPIVGLIIVRSYKITKR